MKILKILCGLLALSIIAQFYFVNKVNESIELTSWNEKRYSVSNLGNNLIVLLDKNTGRTWKLTRIHGDISWTPMSYDIYVRDENDRVSLSGSAVMNYNYTYFANSIEAYPKDADYFSDEATALVDSFIGDMKNADPKLKRKDLKRRDVIHIMQQVKDYKAAKWFDKFLDPLNGNKTVTKEEDMLKYLTKEEKELYPVAKAIMNEDR